MKVLSDLDYNTEKAVHVLKNSKGSGTGLNKISGRSGILANICIRDSTTSQLNLKEYLILERGQATLLKRQ